MIFLQDELQSAGNNCRQDPIFEVFKSSCTPSSIGVIDHLMRSYNSLRTAFEKKLKGAP